MNKKLNGYPMIVKAKTSEIIEALKEIDSEYVDITTDEERNEIKFYKHKPSEKTDNDNNEYDINNMIG